MLKVATNFLTSLNRNFEKNYKVNRSMIPHVQVLHLDGDGVRRNLQPNLEARSPGGEVVEKREKVAGVVEQHLGQWGLKDQRKQNPRVECPAVISIPRSQLLRHGTEVKIPDHTLLHVGEPNQW